MMKKILTSKLLLIVLPLISTTALAHPGHMTNESVHGFLHVEHIVALAMLGVVAYIVHEFGKK
jgi:hypothetical protein